MNKFRIEIISALIVMFATIGIVVADGTIAVTNITEAGTIRRTDIYWNSLTNRSDGTISYFNGAVERVTIKNGTGQTNNYFVAITDNNSVDLLKGAGTCSSNVTVDVCPAVQLYNTVTVGVTGSVPISVCSPLTVAVTNTGVSKGRISIYYRQ